MFQLMISKVKLTSGNGKVQSSFMRVSKWAKWRAPLKMRKLWSQVPGYSIHINTDSPRMWHSPARKGRLSQKSVSSMSKQRPQLQYTPTTWDSTTAILTRRYYLLVATRYYLVVQDKKETTSYPFLTGICREEKKVQVPLEKALP